jgi:hypothetical protein
MVKVQLTLRTEELTRDDPPITMDIIVNDTMDGPDLARELCQLYSTAYARDATITFQLAHGMLLAMPARHINLFQVNHIYGRA